MINLAIYGYVCLTGSPEFDWTLAMLALIADMLIAGSFRNSSTVTYNG